MGKKNWCAHKMKAGRLEAGSCGKIPAGRDEKVPVCQTPLIALQEVSLTIPILPTISILKEPEKQTVNKLPLSPQQIPKGKNRKKSGRISWICDPAV